MTTGVIFDIDGVLIDVRRSYRRAIVETIAREHGATIDQATVDRFKQAGGFNNDWDLTTAAAIAVELQRHTGTAPRSFAATIADAGGGLEGAAVALIDAVGGTDAETITAGVDPGRLREVFQALYLGDALYAELEGASAPFEAPGFIRDGRDRRVGRRGGGGHRPARGGGADRPRAHAAVGRTRGGGDDG
jgi:HAD superfamily hydrolase (TIGR01548 family)